MNKLLSIVALAILVVVGLTSGVDAAGRCDTACSNEPSCSSGQCSLTNCVETDQCYTFCLDCSGQRTCYASGAFCTNSARKTSSTFTLFAISIGLVAARCL